MTDLTVSAGPPDGRDVTALRCDYLFVVLDAARPRGAPLRISLDGIDAVTIGRGAAGVTSTRRAVELRLDDKLVSSAHARLTRALAGWVLEDLGSKNGTVVDAAPAARAELADGAWIEIGHTFLRLRTGLPVVATPAALPPSVSLLATLLPALERAFEELARVSRAPVSVVLEGETGTGKEVLARAVHQLSGRSGDFVGINCGALAPNLVESELFGHRKGAFSGALEDRPGLVRAASGGTLFLDELGDLPRPAQAALLRVLQEREVLPVGAVKPLAVDLRLVASTLRPLGELVKDGSLRPDLATRLAGHSVALPPLRERREDLGLIIAALLGRLEPAGAEPVRLAPRAARAILAHDWPGNIRELEKALAAALALTTDRQIALAQLPQLAPPAPVAPTPAPPARATPAPAPATLADELESIERARMIEALAAEHGHQTRAAARLGMPLRTFQKKLRRYGLGRPG